MTLKQQVTLVLILSVVSAIMFGVTCNNPDPAFRLGYGLGASLWVWATWLVILAVAKLVRWLTKETA